MPRSPRFTSVSENKTHLRGSARKIISVALCLTAMVVPCSARTLQYRTYVVPRPNETIQGNCEYELTIPDASHPVSAVLVVFERGWQFGNLYFDPAVSAFAARHHMATMLAHHCRSKEREDMDVV